MVGPHTEPRLFPAPPILDEVCPLNSGPVEPSAFDRR